MCLCVNKTLFLRLLGTQSAHSSKPNVLKVQLPAELQLYTHMHRSAKKLSLSKQCLISRTLWSTPNTIIVVTVGGFT